MNLQILRLQEHDFEQSGGVTFSFTHNLNF